MSRQDIIFFVIVAAIFAPFFASPAVYDAYTAFNASHGMVAAFIKFAVLSTLGEMIGLRIVRGRYWMRGFGVLPRMIVWGVLGVCINGAFIVFSHGIPELLGYLGFPGLVEQFQAPGFSWGKVAVALCISVALNTFFAPVFMTFHKITDTHISRHGGRLSAFAAPIAMGEIMAGLDWARQWSFVFKRTIPLFWYPAHTVTFMLPPTARVLFAALLGLVLGILLSLAAKSRQPTQAPA